MRYRCHFGPVTDLLGLPILCEWAVRRKLVGYVMSKSDEKDIARVAK